MNPSPDPASPSEEAPKLVPSRYYAHLSEQREEQEEAALLLPEQRLFPFEEAASSAPTRATSPKRTRPASIEPRSMPLSFGYCAV
jgi:hypothetical protein